MPDLRNAIQKRAAEVAGEIEPEALAHMIAKLEHQRDNGSFGPLDALRLDTLRTEWNEVMAGANSLYRHRMEKFLADARKAGPGGLVPTIDPYGDKEYVTHDGIRAAPINGGRYLVYFPNGWVDDLGDPFHRPAQIKGLESVKTMIDKVRGWQKN